MSVHVAPESVFTLARNTHITMGSALNRPFAEWKDTFPNAACVVTLVDRLLHRAELAAIDGESYRLKEAKDRADKKQKARQRS